MSASKPTRVPAQDHVRPKPPLRQAQEATRADSPQLAMHARSMVDGFRALGPGGMSHLQRSLGNRAVLQLLRTDDPHPHGAPGAAIPSLAVQRHLVGQLVDLEQSVSDHVTAVATEPTGPAPSPAGPTEAPPSATSATDSSSTSEATTPPVDVPALMLPTPVTAPKDQDQIRGEVNTFAPTGGNVVAYIQARITDAKQIPGLISLVPRAGLVDPLANDMAARSGTPRDGECNAAAEREVANGGGGFTGFDGRIYVLSSAENSSALFHEVIHVLSGSGGTSPLSALKMQLNEGVTNFFAEEVTAVSGGTVFDAYPFPTVWARKFVAAHGYDVAYDIYFKGNLTKLYETLGRRYLEKLQANTVGTFRAPELNNAKTSGAWSEAKAIATVTTKIKGADFFEATAFANQWFESRVF